MGAKERTASWQGRRFWAVGAAVIAALLIGAAAAFAVSAQGNADATGSSAAGQSAYAAEQQGAAATTMGAQSNFEFTVLDAEGNVVSEGDSLTPADFRTSSGTVRVSVNRNAAQTGNTATITLPIWFSWYQAHGGEDYAVQTSSSAVAMGTGTDNVLAITFDDLGSGEKTSSIDFNFRLNENALTADGIESLETGGLQNMVFSGTLSNSAGTTSANNLTVGYAWDAVPDPDITDLYVGPVGNLYGYSNTHPNPGVIETGIYNNLNRNSNTLSQATMNATDPYRYGCAIDSITITLDDTAADIYQINGLSSATAGTDTISTYGNFNAQVSSDGKTLTLTPKDAISSVDLTQVDAKRLVGAVNLGFRLANNGVYDRDSWYTSLFDGAINSGNLLHMTVNYKPFTTSQTGADDIQASATSTMSVVSYSTTDPEVLQTSADTSTYLTNQREHGDDPLTVAAVVDGAGATDQTVWIGEGINNLAAYTETSNEVTIHTDASGMALVTEYPYEVRGTEYQIRPKYAAAASSLADQFSPGGFELSKVVFTLSDGSTVEVSADNATFASAWNAALSSNGTMTVTADQLGVASSFTSSNEASVACVTKVTQVFKTATPSIITDTSNYWSFRMTKWSTTTYEQDGTTELGTGSLTHADGVVEQGGKRWYPITSTLYTDASLGTKVGSAEHNIQVREVNCPEFQMVSTRGGQWQYNQWKYESENETGSFLGIRVKSGTDLSTVKTTLTNPTFDIYHYWMDNVYTWTGEMDVTPAMAGWTVTYGVTTYAKQAAGQAVEVRTMQLPSAADFQDPSKTNEDGTITIDLLPNTDGDETGSDWEYFAASSAVDVGTDGFGRVEPVEISFHYDGDWDVTKVADSDGDGVIDDNGTDGFLVKNIQASSRTIDPDGQYGYYLWWDGGHITKMCYQWDNCEDNDAAHLSTATSASGTGNWGHELASTVEQLGAQILEPTGLSADWSGTLVQGSTTTISGSLTLTANPIGSPEWQPSGDVLYLEFPDESIQFAGNASIDGVSDPDAYVTTINGTRYLVIHDNASADTVKSATSDTSTDWQHPSSNITYEPLDVSFDVYTMPTASTTEATEVIGSNTYLDFSGHQYYANVSNNPSDGTYHTAIQKKGLLNWNGARNGLGNGACVDNPLGVHTKADITDRYWAIKTTGVSLTPALNTNLGLVSYSGTNASADDSSDALVTVTGTKVVKPGEEDTLESLVALGAGDNGLTNAQIVVKIPTEGDTVSDSTGTYTNTTGLTLRGAVKQYGTLNSGETMTLQVSTDGVTYSDITDATDWSQVRYVKATIDSLSANEVAMFTLPLSAADGTQSGDVAYLGADASFVDNNQTVQPRSVSGYRFDNIKISGTAWTDADADGMMDADETARVAGVTMTAYVDNVEAGSAVTAADGTYTIELAQTGTVRVKAQPQQNISTYSATTDNRFNPDNATSELGTVTADVTGVNIGYVSPATVTITGIKTLTENGQAKAFATGDFQARIVGDSQSGYTGPTNSVCDINTDGTFTFDTITFTKPGTYHFTVTEVADETNEGYTYDSSAYNVTVTVAANDEGTGLAATTTIEKDGTAVDAITFANTYTKPTVTIPVVKAWDSGVAMSSVTIGLYNGTQKVDEVTLDGTVDDVETSAWHASFTADKYDSTGAAIAYTVDEVTKGNPYSVTGNMTNGFTVTNHAPAEADITATKTLDGQTPAAQAFSFQLKGSDGTVLQTKSNDASGTVTFDTLQFTAAGTYTYTVSEVAGTDPMLTYDSSVYTVVVTVTGATDGTLSQSTAITKNGTAVDGITFANTTASSVTGTGVGVTKTLTGDTPEQSSTFTFTMAADPDDSTLPSGMTGATMPMPQSTTATVTGAGSTQFGSITFSKPGTYVYTVTENQGDVLGYTYDDTVYTVTYTVTAANGQLSVSGPTITSDGAAAQGIAFSNTYTAPSPDTVAISGSKTLTQDGTALAMTDGQFQASVTADDANDTTGYTDFAGGTYDIGANGGFTTGDITFTKAGTYTFHVSEVQGTDARYTYDSTTYDVVVTVALADNSNELEASTAITSDGVAQDGITFANTKMSAQDIEVTKQWVGPTTDSVTVNLLANGTVVETAELTPGSNWAATFSVDAIDAAGNDIAYTVTEDAVPNFTTQITGDEADGFVVTNTYEGIVVNDPPVTKTVTGDTPDADATFAFTLAAQPEESTLPDGMTAMPMPAAADGAQSMQTTIVGSGTSEFGELTFTQAGTYVYRVTEENTGETGYTYDTSVYEVIYTVENGNGELTCTRTITKDGEVVDQASFDFTNVYQNPTPATPDEPTTNGDDNGTTSTTSTDTGSASATQTDGGSSASVATMPTTNDGTMAIVVLLIGIAAIAGTVIAVARRRRNRD
jgi:pilin isopeptide linkage protein